MSDRQQKRKNKTYTALTAAATQLFAEKGIYQVSIDDITTAADLGKGTFYKHFANRDDLVAAVVRQGFQLLFEELFPADRDQAITNMGQAILEGHFRFFETHPNYLLIFHQARGWLKLLKPAENPIRTEFIRYIDKLADGIRASSGGKIYSLEQSIRFARIVAGSIAGIFSFEYITGDGLEITPEIRLFFDNLFQPLPPQQVPSNAVFISNDIVVKKEFPSLEIHSGALSESDTWSARKFFEDAPDWLAMLRQTSNLDQIRVALLERINYRHFMAYSEHTGIHPLDLVIIRDAARAWRGILHPRSEKLVNFSVLNALLDVAQGRLRPELTAAFWAEIHHLVTAIDGNVRIHSIDARVMTSALKGRDAAQWRSAQLDWLGKSLADRSTRYRHGLNDDVIMQRNQHRAEILTAFGGSENDWQEWRWHLKHIIRNAENLERVVTLSAEEKKRIALALEQGLPFGITPYYAMLFDQPADTDHDRAIRAQVIPPLSYLDAFASIPHDGVATDFMQEMDNSPIDLVTRRYVAVAILKPYASCPQICVYCQRNWEIHEPLAQGAMAPKKQIDEAIAWLSDHPTIHDVLLTGGDPLVLSDAWLKKLLGALAAIPHIERIRIGTRMLATLPQRFNTPLVKLLKTYQLPGRREICVVTHIQHPYELTPELVKAVNRLRQEGIAVYNQLVYTFYVSRRFEAAMLRRLLRRCGIEPYYTFYPKGKLEMADYRVPIARLLQEQKEESRLFPGMERTDEPVYNVPGLGKNYLNSWQHRDLISIRPDGARMYEFHPWEKKIMPQQTYIGADVPILDYLERLKMIGETLEDYESIWYYY